jgi:hypothetical protein
MKDPKKGEEAICVACGEKIRYNGNLWFHINTDPRHIAVPLKPSDVNEYDLTKHSDTRFKTTDFVVEANSCESLYLWKDCQERKNEWVQDNSGLMVKVGEVNDMPVNISVLWNTVDDLKVLFWHPISRMVDYDMITDWFVRNCDPKYCNGERRAKTNAQNFHLVIHEAKDRKEKWYVTGDHPISLRPDKYGLTRDEAEDYAKELEKYGFENIEIYLDKKD